MDLRTYTGLLTLIFFLFLNPIKLLAQCTVAAGGSVEEVRVLPFDYKVPVDSFDNMLSLFAEELGDDPSIEIGGFVCIPVRMAEPSNEEEQTRARDTIPFISKGMRIYLAYYRTNPTDGTRSIGMFRYDTTAMAPCVNVPQDKPGVITLPAKDESNRFATRLTRLLPDDESAFQGADPMDLSYLSYDNYLYLRSNSFYPLAENPAEQKEVTHIIIKRAMSNQMFNLTDTTNYELRQYRTLSFQPYPYAELGTNQEAVMAFKYGYYCPPYWTSDPPPDDTLSRSVNRQLPFDFSLERKGPEGQTFVADVPIVKVPAEEEVYQALDGFIESQITMREIIIDENDGFWKKYGSIIIAILILMLAFTAGKFIVN